MRASIHKKLATRGHSCCCHEYRAHIQCHLVLLLLCLVSKRANAALSFSRGVHLTTLLEQFTSALQLTLLAKAAPASSVRRATAHTRQRRGKQNRPNQQVQPWSIKNHRVRKLSQLKTGTSSLACIDSGLMGQNVHCNLYRLAAVPCDIIIARGKATM